MNGPVEQPQSQENPEAPHQTGGDQRGVKIAVVVMVLVMIGLVIGSLVWSVGGFGGHGNEKDKAGTAEDGSEEKMAEEGVTTSDLIEFENEQLGVFRNSEHDFAFLYPRSAVVRAVEAAGADLRLIIENESPDFDITVYVNHAGVGFEGWEHYKPTKSVSAFGKEVSVLYLRHSEASRNNDRLLVSVFKDQDDQFLLTARTDSADLEEKERIFEEVVGSFGRTGEGS